MLQMSVNMNCDCDWRRRIEMGDRQDGCGKREREREREWGEGSVRWCDRCAGVLSIIWKIKVINEQYT